MKKYNRVMLGKGSMYAKICREEGYIGAEFDIFVDLSDSLYENWRDFNEKFIPCKLFAKNEHTKVRYSLIRYVLA